MAHNAEEYAKIFSYLASSQAIHLQSNSISGQYTKFLKYYNNNLVYCQEINALAL